jgi:ferrous iron transport protein A
LSSVNIYTYDNDNWYHRSGGEGPKMSRVLSDLLPGEKGIVKKVTGTSMIKRRIVDMGVVTGAVIEVQKFAPLGDPMEVKVKGFNLSLRKNEAEMIEMETA